MVACYCQVRPAGFHYNHLDWRNVDVINTATFEQLVFTAVWAAILLIATFAFTILPSKDPDWDHAKERV